jgi:tetratricopeptide (TPR) repeat protein
MVILGSVSKIDTGLTIETSVLTSDGNVILSQINRARSQKEIRRTTKIIVSNILAQFPFEGTIAGIDDEGYRINLGQSDYQIRRGSEFRYMAANLDSIGRVRGFREAGTLRVVKTDETSSWAEVADISAGEEIKVGDKVIRLAYIEEERDAAKDSFTLFAQGGFPPDQKPLWGVNVYLDNTWMGTTGSNGKVEVPVRLYGEYDLLLTRHGYQQVRDELSIDASKQVKEYFFEVANAAFNVESEPSGAEVYVDGVKLGETPMRDGKLVNFGFRKVRLVKGGEYRDWEKVIEFNRSEVNLTGSNKVTFLKDWMQIGRNAEAGGNIDAAIEAYINTERENPDYSAARNRLAQLYMDEKNNFDAAIQEFENVLALPENRQVIYKQYAVTYTNLGHAYYEKGNEQVLKDKRAAAGNFAKAIQKLKIAKQNTRFFPNNQFDEAVHDTYYYLAISYHKLYLITKKSSVLYNAKLAWREYFDFFPRKLESSSGFVKMRDSARKYYSQIKDLS